MNIEIHVVFSIIDGNLLGYLYVYFHLKEDPGAENHQVVNSKIFTVLLVKEEVDK